MLVHLDECEPEGKGWRQAEFGEAVNWPEGPKMCPAVEYMRNELYVDELVWIEDEKAEVG
jgi:hypothetical protein